jgi:hypothetical protein
MGGLPDQSPIMWFSNWTFIPEEQTIDPSLYTMPDFHGDAYTIWDRASCLVPFPGYPCRAWYPTNPERNPWMAPGSAPVFRTVRVGRRKPGGVWGSGGGRGVPRGRL